MTYFFALLMAGVGGIFFLMANHSKGNLMELRQLEQNKDNRRQSQGRLEIMDVRRSRFGLEYDGRLTFETQNGEEQTYNEHYLGVNSKVSFLLECGSKGTKDVQVVYDKRDPNLHYIQELKPIETNQNSVVGLRIVGSLFVVMGLVILAEALGLLEKML